MGMTPQYFHTIPILLLLLDTRQEKGAKDAKYNKLN